MNRIAQEAHARQRYIEYYLKHGNATETAIRYEISRKTLYKRLKRYDGTWESLMERSRRPHRTPRAHAIGDPADPTGLCETFSTTI